MFMSKMKSLVLILIAMKKYVFTYTYCYLCDPSVWSFYVIYADSEKEADELFYSHSFDEFIEVTKKEVESA